MSGGILTCEACGATHDGDHLTHWDAGTREVIAREVAKALQAADADHAEQIKAAVEDIGERIAQAIEADYAAWASVDGSAPIVIPMHSAAWFVGRTYETAARIAREAGWS